MCVNCMMKLKPLVFNEKYEPGPKPAGGLGVPGVCRKQPEPGAEGESRVISGLAGPAAARAGRTRGPRLTTHSREKLGPPPCLEGTEACSRRSSESIIWNFLWQL